MRKCVLLLVMILLLTVPCTATEIQDTQAERPQTDELLDALPDTAKELLPDFNPNSAKETQNTINTIWKKAVDKVFPTIKTSLKTGATILLILLLCQTVLTFSKGTSRNAVILCGVVAIITCAINSLEGVVASGSSAIQELGTFAKILMPVLGGALTASCAPASSAAISAVAIFAINLMVSLIEKVLIPAVYVYLSFAVADVALVDVNTSRFQKLIGSGIKNVLKIVLFSFSALLSFTGILSGKADAMTLKATKMAISSVVPVVGGMISDASETVLVGAGMLLHSVGLMGMLAILAIVIVPFLHLGIQYLILQVVTALGALFGCKEHTALTEAISAATGYLFAATCTCGLMCFVACICFMKVSVI